MLPQSLHDLQLNVVGAPLDPGSISHPNQAAYAIAEAFIQRSPNVTEALPNFNQLTIGDPAMVSSPFVVEPWAPTLAPQQARPKEVDSTLYKAILKMQDHLLGAP